MVNSIIFPLGDRTTLEDLDELDLQELQFFNKNRLELDILDINPSENSRMSDEDNDVIDDLDINLTELNDNLFSDEDPELLIKHEKCLDEECKFIPVCCLNEGHHLLASMADNPETVFDLKEAGLLEETETEEELIELKIPSPSMDDLLKIEEEKEKSKPYLTVVQNNNVACFIDGNETSLKHLGMRKELALKKAFLSK